MPLGLVQDLIHGVEHGHALVHVLQLLRVDGWLVGGVEDLAVPVHHPVDGDAVGHVRLQDLQLLGVRGLGAGELREVLGLRAVPRPPQPRAAAGGEAPGEQQPGHATSHV